MTFFLFVALLFNPAAGTPVQASVNSKACIAQPYAPLPVFTPLCQPCFYYAPNCYHNNFAFEDGVARYQRERGIYIEQVYRPQLEALFGPLNQNCVEQYVSDAYDAVQARVNEAYANRVICDY